LASELDREIEVLEQSVEIRSFQLGALGSLAHDPKSTRRIEHEASVPSLDAAMPNGTRSQLHRANRSKPLVDRHERARGTPRADQFLVPKSTCERTSDGVAEHRQFDAPLPHDHLGARPGREHGQENGGAISLQSELPDFPISGQLHAMFGPPSRRQIDGGLA
jgi:hypothetical protein